MQIPDLKIHKSFSRKDSEFVLKVSMFDSHLGGLIWSPPTHTNRQVGLIVELNYRKECVFVLKKYNLEVTSCEARRHATSGDHVSV